MQRQSTTEDSGTGGSGDFSAPHIVVPMASFIAILFRLRRCLQICLLRAPGSSEVAERFQSRNKTMRVYHVSAVFGAGALWRTHHSELMSDQFLCPSPLAPISGVTPSWSRLPYHQCTHNLRLVCLSSSMWWQHFGILSCACVMRAPHCLNDLDSQRLLGVGWSGVGRRSTT